MDVVEGYPEVSLVGLVRIETSLAQKILGKDSVRYDYGSDALYYGKPMHAI